MRKTVALLVALSIFAVGPAAAVNCALDVAPAGTLLLPYFAFDLKKLNKPTKTDVTTVVINNQSDDEALVHVIVWSDLALPSVDWDIKLAPFGSQEIPIHEIFRGDRLEYPGIDPENPVVSPGGDGRPKEVVRDFHAGRPVDGTCRGFPHGDQIARGYITFDNASDTINVLTGHVRYDNKKRKYGSIEPLVHLERNGRAEGLGSVWSTEYDLRNGSRTELIVWRDPGEEGSSIDVDSACDLPEPNGWYPLGQEAFASDRVGNMMEILEEGGESIPGFPLATGAYELGTGDLQLPYEAGLLILDFRGDGQSYVSFRQTFQSSRRQGRGTAAPLREIQCSSNGTVFTRRGSQR